MNKTWLEDQLKAAIEDNRISAMRAAEEVGAEFIDSNALAPDWVIEIVDRVNSKTSTPEGLKACIHLKQVGIITYHSWSDLLLCLDCSDKLVQHRVHEMGDKLPKCYQCHKQILHTDDLNYSFVAVENIRVISEICKDCLQEII